MSATPSVPRFSRWSKSFDYAARVDRVRFTTPSGLVETRSAFDHQPAEFQYDLHGYEEMIPAGPIVKMVRYTPKEPGQYHFEALAGGQPVQTGDFTCTPSDHPGYVILSPRDPRYFALSNGQSFCAIGTNLCAPPSYPLPQGMEHFEVGNRQATLGLREFQRWFRLLSENGGNFTRIWLSNAYLQPETETAGQIDILKLNRLDGLVEIARHYGIRLKLCFDHFRAFQSTNPVTRSFFMRNLTDPNTGQQAASMDEWMESPTWQELWFQKVQALLDRYGGDPTVMAWELWNEMDCIETRRWDLVREWTRLMLSRIKAQEPDQLVVQSLGSFDEEHKSIVQDDLRDMPEMDFQQVHRYLDQGAPWKICTEDPVAFSIDAVERTRRPDRPILLAETGAVNDRHTGPFRYYRMDERGMIFHDTTFPSFFAGAAGTGQNWWWDSYVDQKHLWGQFRPFADLLERVELDRQDFQPVDLSDQQTWCLGLLGKTTILLWVRNRADTWHAVLRDESEPAPVDIRVDFSAAAFTPGKFEVYPCWPNVEENMEARLENTHLHLRGLKYGVMVKLEP